VTETEQDSKERSNSLKNVSKEELLKSYGAKTISLVGGFYRFEEDALVERIKEMRSLRVTALVHIPLHHERMLEDMNQVINFSLQLTIDKFFLCSKFLPKTDNGEVPQLFDYHLQCENTVKSYYGSSCTIIRTNGIMQDFLLFYDDKTRTFYFPFGDLQSYDDHSKKKVSWVDARDVGLAVCSLVMNFLFQVSSSMTKSIQKASMRRSRRFVSGDLGKISSFPNDVEEADPLISSNPLARDSYTLTGSESLTIKDVINKFSKKTNVPVEYKVIERTVSSGRLINSKGISQWECNALHDVYEMVFDKGHADIITQDIQQLKNSTPTLFDGFIERELQSFQDNNPCICMIGSIHFIQSKLLYALHEQMYRSKNIIFSSKEIPDHPFKTAQYLIFEYDKEKNVIESAVRSEMNDELKRRKTEDLLVQANMISSSYRGARSASASQSTGDLEADDSLDSRVKNYLSEKFLDMVADSVIHSEKLIIFVKAKYLLNKWLDIETFKKIIDIAHRSNKLKHIMILYDSATSRISHEFITKISIYLSMKCTIAYTFVEFGVWMVVSDVSHFVWIRTSITLVTFYTSLL